ncbi:hypothetical protein [Aquitalea sp. ASV15]|uniref:hypothetical protein n=1 Tax=Aquitalea sp. ASV15 TaxID=2795104 RepID=UPI0018EC295D|nr:hypothetical protein [Aquitalea sp. ASV15]
MIINISNIWAKVTIDEMGVVIDKVIEDIENVILISNQYESNDLMRADINEYVIVLNSLLDFGYDRECDEVKNALDSKCTFFESVEADKVIKKNKKIKIYLGGDEYTLLEFLDMYRAGCKFKNFIYKGKSKFLIRNDKVDGSMQLSCVEREELLVFLKRDDVVNSLKSIDHESIKNTIEKYNSILKKLGDSEEERKKAEKKEKLTEKEKNEIISKLVSRLSNFLSIFFDYDKIISKKNGKVIDRVRSVDYLSLDSGDYYYKPLSSLGNANACQDENEDEDEDEDEDDKKINAYRILESGLYFRVCPYCHINSIVRSPSTEYLNDMYRPPLDHYYAQSHYPFLALSLGNLIPCCHVCNSTFKIQKNFFNTKHFHPLYDDERIFFSMRIEGDLLVNDYLNIPQKVDFKIINSVHEKDNWPDLVDKFNNTMDTFRLYERYNSSDSFGEDQIVRNFIDVTMEIVNSIESKSELIGEIVDKYNIQRNNVEKYKNMIYGKLMKDISNELIEILNVKEEDGSQLLQCAVESGDIRLNCEK